jgi:hypothetical protein
LELYYCLTSNIGAELPKVIVYQLLREREPGSLPPGCSTTQAVRLQIPCLKPSPCTSKQEGHCRGPWRQTSRPLQGLPLRGPSPGPPLRAPCEASPHKRRLKCDTNISPGRLMTHLLHQMVHRRTTLRGNGQRSTTIARITTHTHTTILIIKRGSSESCAMRNLLRVTRIHRQGWV